MSLVDTYHTTKKDFVAKIFFNDLCQFDNKTIDDVINEIIICTNLYHPTILHVHGYSLKDFNNNNKLVIITEFLEQCPLSYIIEGKFKYKQISSLSDTQKLIMIYGIASGMLYLHKNNILHRDLKPENIFITRECLPKISNYGIAKKISGWVETPEYLPPEFITNHEYNEAVDIYAFGVIVYEIMSAKRFSIQKEKPPEIDDTFPQAYRELIEDCWSQNPESRPTFYEIVQQLLENDGFITDSVNKEQYYDYIDEVNKRTIIYRQNNDSSSRKYLQFNEMFTKIEIIGNGSFGKVYKVKYNKNKKIFAAKVLIEHSDERKFEFAKEIYILTQLFHPAIIRFLLLSDFDFKNRPNKVVVTEYARYGTLKDYIVSERNKQPKKWWNDTQKLIIAYAIASAMSYIHRKSILHRDLKPDNILIGSRLIPKIADFGLSKKLSEDFGYWMGSTKNPFLETYKPEGLLGTPYYMSPEIYINYKYTKAGDVYAYGLILYEMFTGCTVYPNDVNFMSIYKYLSSGYRPRFNGSIPSAYKRLIKDCWSDFPNARPTFDQIVDRLRNDPAFITDKIDSENYFRYVDIIENKNYKYRSFNIGELLKDIVIPESIDLYKKKRKDRFEYKFKLFPYEEYIKLENEGFIKYIESAEYDSSSQLDLAKLLIKGVEPYPYDVQLGIKYLKLACKKNKEAIIYYIRLLIKGYVIPPNPKKAKKLVEQLKEDKSIYLFLYGKIYKREKEYEKAIKCFEDSMKEGNVKSIYECAKMHMKGQGVAKNEEKGNEYYLKACEKGYKHAMLKYGFYLIHNSSEDDTRHSLGEEYIRKAAKLGSAKAQCAYGFILLQKINKIESAELRNNKIKSCANYFLRAMMKGNTEAFRMYSSYLFQVIPNSDSPNIQDDALKLMKKSADKGNANALYEYSHMIKQMESPEYVKYLQYAAVSGVSEAMNEYGEWIINQYKYKYEASLRYECSLEKAAEYKKILDEAPKYFKMAADNDCINGILSYARYLYGTWDHHIDLEESKRYYKMAADKGNAEGMLQYAKLLELTALNHEETINNDDHEKAESNYEEVIAYYKMAIDQGNAEAMRRYADILENGLFVPPNHKEAINYYEKAAENGDPMAMITCYIFAKNFKGIRYSKKDYYYDMIERCNLLEFLEYKESNPCSNFEFDFDENYRKYYYE